MTLLGLFGYKQTFSLQKVDQIIQDSNEIFLHYKRKWYAFLFTDNHDVLFNKRMIWFSSLYC